MKNKLTITILIIQLCFSLACAKNFQSTDAEAQKYSVEFTVKIKEDSKISASIKSPKTEVSENLSSSDELPEFYARFKDEIAQSDDSKITISVDQPVSVEMSTDLFLQAKNSGVKRAYIKNEGKFLVKDFEVDEDDLQPPKSDKPNPFILIVTWEKNGKIRLNNEDFGKINDLVALEKKLVDVFAARKELKAYPEGKNEIDSSVYLKIPAATSAFDTDLEKMQKLLKKAGASPVRIIFDKVQDNEKTEDKSSFDKIVFEFKDSSVAPDYQRNYKIVLTKTSAEIVLKSYKVLDHENIRITAEQFNKIVKIVNDANLKNRPNLDDDGCAGGTTDTFDFSKNGKSILTGNVYHCAGNEYGNLIGETDAVKNELTSLFPKVKAKFRNIELNRQ